jgi:hypothetical protein
MEKIRLEVPFLTLNKHGNLLTTSLSLDVHRASSLLFIIYMTKLLQTDWIRGVQLFH